MEKKKNRRWDYHYVYKIVCRATGCYYIGVHSTNDLEDGYLGSGTRVRESIKQHGRENHSKEVLTLCDTREAANKLESELVNEETLLDNKCLNLAMGGKNGKLASREIARIAQRAGAKKMRELWEVNPEWREKFSEAHSRQNKKRVELGTHHFLGGDIWRGKEHKEETREKMSLTHKLRGNHQGEKNSQFGTCWIYNKVSLENKKIPKSSLGEYIKKGWTKGRKMNT